MEARKGHKAFEWNGIVYFVGGEVMRNRLDANSTPGNQVRGDLSVPTTLMHEQVFTSGYRMDIWQYNISAPCAHARPQ